MFISVVCMDCKHLLHQMLTNRLSSVIWKGSSLSLGSKCSTLPSDSSCKQDWVILLAYHPFLQEINHVEAHNTLIQIKVSSPNISSWRLVTDIGIVLHAANIRGGGCDCRRRVQFQEHFVSFTITTHTYSVTPAMPGTVLDIVHLQCPGFLLHYDEMLKIRSRKCQVYGYN